MGCIDFCEYLCQWCGYCDDSENSIDLSGKKLKEFPDVSGLPNLKSLTLRNNEISHVNPDPIAKTISWLDLSRNRLTDVADFREHEQLLMLILDYNHITYVDPKYLPLGLQYLLMRHNALTEMPDFTRRFADLTDIEYMSRYGLQGVYLSHNNIKILNASHLLYCITMLDLSFNSITEVGDISINSRLKTLFLKGNPLKSIVGLPENLEELTIDANIEVLGKKCFSKESYNMLIKTDVNTDSLIDPPLDVFTQGLEAVIVYYSKKQDQAWGVR